jgi:hypothetical protein
VRNAHPTAGGFKKPGWQKTRFLLGDGVLYSLVNLLDEIGFQLAVNIKNNSVA